MDLSVVNHEDYFAKIGDDHKFPINKFGELANYLLEKKIVNKFYEPTACSDETLKRAHSEKYIKNVKKAYYQSKSFYYQSGLKYFIKLVIYQFRINL